MLSIIIPVYNEENSIKEVVKECLSLKIDKEVVVVDDGSTDNSLKVIEFEFGDKVKIVKNKKNMGKGFSLVKGIKEAKGNFIAFQDADFEYPPKNLEYLYSACLDGYDSVIGVRSITWEDLNNISLGSFIANKIIYKLTSLPDVFTGHRIIKKNVLEEINISSSGFDIETEITLKLVNNGYKVKWIPIKYIPRTREEGKKIGAWDFFIIMYRYFKLKKKVSLEIHKEPIKE